MLRYQLRPPRKPVRVNSAAKTSMSASVSHAGSVGGFDRARQEAARLWNHARRAVAKRIVGLARSIARPGIEESSDRIARTTPKLRLREARRLEIELIEERRVGLRHCARRPSGAARHERHAQARDGAKAVGPKKRAMPRDRRAPVVADDGGLRRAERVEHANHVADQVKQRVLIDLGGLACLAIAAHVGRDSAIACLGERLQLKAPRIPGLRKTVAEEHERPASRLSEMDGNPVCLDCAMGDLGHAPSPSIWHRCTRVR